MRAITVMVGLLLAMPAVAQEKKDAPERARNAMEAVRKHLSGLKGAEAAMLLWKDEKAVEATFPDHVFVIVRFRIYPVARIMPEGMQASNILAVSSKGKIDHVKDIAALRKFFGEHAKGLMGEDRARQGLATWLALSQEFHQDGMFKFEVLEKDIAIEKSGDALTARGRALVVGGGNGEIAATASFADGKLSNLDEKAKVIPGPRPICQATKLLDPDPIVCRMAEQDLIYMGLAARDYIMEQRAKAGPDLREAIDRLWERIVKNGW